MSFHVEPAALRDYARQLGDVERVAADAGRYVEAHGSFGFHEQGIIGFAAPGHRQLMTDLRSLLTKLNQLGVASQQALRAVADTYEQTDERSAATVDATYPTASRTAPGQD